MSSNEPIVVDKDERDLFLGLPPANTKRWLSRRKAAVVLATRAGVITREEACKRYALSHEELATWEAAFDQDGVGALRINRLQNYRDSSTGDRRGHVRPMGGRQIGPTRDG